jgi:hypothetical protein
MLVYSALRRPPEILALPPSRARASYQGLCGIQNAGASLLYAIYGL